MFIAQIMLLGKMYGINVCFINKIQKAYGAFVDYGNIFDLLLINYFYGNSRKRQEDLKRCLKGYVISLPD